MKFNRFQNSLQLFEEARGYLAGGVSSQFRALGKPHPMFFSHGRGSRIFDVDGNEYIDFTLSQGPLILGHSHPEFLRKIHEELQRGQLYAGQFELELRLARRLAELLPDDNRLVRFCNSGSEAVHAAIRLARAATGKDKILKFEGHYHGWFDNMLISVHPPLEAAGAPERPRPVAWSQGQPPSVLEEAVIAPWNDLEAIEQILRGDPDVAAVITEPIMCNTGCILPQKGYLEGLRRLCDQFRILLIFDEIITGFRVAFGGAQEYFRVNADIVTYGKAMASGFPISAIVGRKEYMDYIADGRVMHAGTLNSNNACVAASMATLDILSKDHPAPYCQLYKIGNLLIEGLRALGRRHGQPLLVLGPGPMFHAGFSNQKSVWNYRDSLCYDSEKLQRFTTGMLENGVRLIGRGLWYVSLAHSEQDVERTLEVADKVLETL